MDNTSARIPVRLVVCVDGTWFGPDGLYSGWSGNISNIFRISCCVKEGTVQDLNTTWRQECVYIKGIDNPSNWGNRLLIGAFGAGLAEQIKHVYKICCQKAAFPEDEVFLFGFSRGAFVVRAVANLLAYMRIATPMHGQDWEEAYVTMLNLYKDVRSGNSNRSGSIHEYMSRCLPPPRIQLIAVIDTVKAFDDDDLYDIALHPSLRHCRQALALHETKTAFVPELWLSTEDQDVLEAWFIGSHGDLGGGNAQDGLALYPCQWLLHEAQKLGLHLSFTSVTYNSLDRRNKATMDNPLDLCFPSNVDAEGNSLAHVITSANGVQTMIWDMVHVHKLPGYDVRIKQRPPHWIFSTAPRNVFVGAQLAGWRQDVQSGVFIHPSAYMLQDTDDRISSSALGWSFQDGFNSFRQQIIPDSSYVFWQKSLDPADSVIDETKFRMLVCGDAGVGKSTLINLLLGVPDLTSESERQHGKHDIEQGFSPQGARYVVHDSCGFQAGQDSEIQAVKDFLQTRLATGNFAERLHIVLYCIAATRVRTTESADKSFFDTLKTLDTNVPVIVVATRFDELEALCSDQIEEDYMKKYHKRSRRHLLPSDWDEIEGQTHTFLEEKKQALTTDFSALHFPFSGPVFISKRSKETIQEVVQVITDSLSDAALRKMFIAAQICSLQPKIDYALSHSITLYKTAVQTAAMPIAWSGLMASSAANVFIVQDVLGTFGYTSYSKDVASQIISTALFSNYKSNGIYITGTVINAAAAAAAGTGVGIVAAGALGGMWYASKLVSIPQFARMLLMCTVDTILIMELAWWQCNNEIPTTQHIEAACAIYKNTVDRVHADVKGVLGIWDSYKAFQFEAVRLEMVKIIDRYRSRKRDEKDGDADTHDVFEEQPDLKPDDVIVDGE